MVLLDEGDHQWAHRDDPQPGVAAFRQRLVDENRCQTAPAEFVEHLRMGEDALAIAICELDEDPDDDQAPTSAAEL